MRERARFGGGDGCPEGQPLPSSQLGDFERVPWLCGLQKKEDTERKKCFPKYSFCGCICFPTGLGVGGRSWKAKRSSLTLTGHARLEGECLRQAGESPGIESSNNSGCSRMRLPQPLHLWAPSRSLSPGFRVPEPLSGEAPGKL